MRIYSRALKNDEIIQLYDRPDHIATRDTIVYINDLVQTDITNTCAINFIWTPDIYLNTPYIAEPMMTFPEAGEFEYVVQMDDNECIAYDTLRVKVVDPSTLDCKTLYVPSAFTPNTDNNNPVFGISNAIVVQDFISFANVFPLDVTIAMQTLEIRKKHQIKLPNAIIAATAIHHNLILITNNEKDFASVKGLKILNPHKL